MERDESSPAAARHIAITWTCETSCAHPGEAARYARLKHQLAPLLRTDRTAYVTGKPT